MGILWVVVKSGAAELPWCRAIAFVMRPEMLAALLISLLTVPGEIDGGGTPAVRGRPTPMASLTALRPNLERLAVRIRGSIEASLIKLTRRDGAALAAQVARLLRWRGDIIANVHPDDRLALLYDPSFPTASGEEAHLFALAYEGAAIALRAYGWPDEAGVWRYYDADGVLVEPRLANSPTAYFQITEVVQQGQGKRRHRGLDLKAPTGTPVVLPFAALINRVNWATRSNGLCVEIIFQDGPAAGKLARFLHLHEVDPLMRAGARLPAGGPVGQVGSTGRSSAPHLHYEIRARDGRPIDPLKAHGSTHPFVDEAQRPAFTEEVRRYDQQLDGAAPSN